MTYRNSKTGEVRHFDKLDDLLAHVESVVQQRTDDAAREFATEDAVTDRDPDDTDAALGFYRVRVEQTLQQIRDMRRLLEN